MSAQKRANARITTETGWRAPKKNAIPTPAAATARDRRALEIKPDYMDAHVNLGNILLQKESVNEAMAHYQKALEINPDSATAHNDLGNAFLQKGRIDEAIFHYPLPERLMHDRRSVVETS